LFHELSRTLIPTIDNSMTITAASRIRPAHLSSERK